MSKYETEPVCANTDLLEKKEKKKKLKQLSVIISHKNLTQHWAVTKTMGYLLYIKKN